MPNTFEYQGTLEETSIPEMFWTIYRHKVPGRIEIARDGATKRIYINEGSVIHASSTDRTDRLGAHLYRLGRLSRDELADTMREREATGKRHGQVLIEKGFLSPGQLYEAIRSQMESIVWSVFAWQSGDLNFKIGHQVDPMMIKIHLPMRQVIVRGIKQVQDTKSLVSRLGKKTTVFKPVYTTEELIEIALEKEEFELLRLVDGRRSLYEVCTAGPFGVSENARLLYAFHVLHLIERASLEDTGVRIRLAAERKPVDDALT
ncbi:MAG: DUF4388 domain-containing protein [Acidobacteriota bacterium]